MNERIPSSLSGNEKENYPSIFGMGNISFCDIYMAMMKMGVVKCFGDEEKGGKSGNGTGRWDSWPWTALQT